MKNDGEKREREREGGGRVYKCVKEEEGERESE